MLSFLDCDEIIRENSKVFGTDTVASNESLELKNVITNAVELCDGISAKWQTFYTSGP